MGEIHMNNLQWLDEVKFNEQGLIPAIAQHHQTGRILMVASGFVGVKAAVTSLRTLGISRLSTKLGFKELAMPFSLAFFFEVMKISI